MIDHTKIEPNCTEDLKTLSFEFEIEDDETIAGIYLRTNCRYTYANIYGDGQFLYKDDREQNEMLSDFYILPRKIPYYNRMTGKYPKYQPNNTDFIFWLPISIPIHTNILTSVDYLPLKDIYVDWFKNISENFSKFKIVYTFDEIPSQTPSLCVKKIIKHYSK